MINIIIEYVFFSGVSVIEKPNNLSKDNNFVEEDLAKLKEQLKDIKDQVLFLQHSAAFCSILQRPLYFVSA